MKFNGFSAYVTIDGETAKEYNETTKDNVTTCYIESKVGAEYSVSVISDGKEPSEYLSNMDKKKYKNVKYWTPLYIDGNGIISPCLISSTTISETSSGQKLYFSKADVSQLTKSDGNTKVGTISLKINICQYHEKSYTKKTIVNEKTSNSKIDFKENSVTEATKFGDSTKNEIECAITTFVKTIHEFKFIYRSRTILICDKIIPETGGLNDETLTEVKDGILARDMEYAMKRRNEQTANEERKRAKRTRYVERVVDDTLLIDLTSYNQPTCAICLETFVDYEDEIPGSVVRRDCDHYFHKKCNALWMDNCALCRA